MNPSFAGKVAVITGGVHGIGKAIKEIAAAYQKAVLHKISDTQIYYVLHRHGRRKIMPRSRHRKKASEEAIDASKN